jgi:2-octaprenyl-6-methoxyphenol hydroxylase
MRRAELQVTGSMNTPSECAVIGTGPAGLAALLALVHIGETVVAIGPIPDEAKARGDTRTTALFPGSINLLRRLGVWGQIETQVAPLVAIRIVDATGNLLRAPETLFRAADIGLDDFGANIGNATLVLSMLGRAVGHPRVRLVDDAVASVVTTPEAVELGLADGRCLTAKIVVAADGRNSRCRAAMGVDTKAWQLPQSALATTFSHRRGHANVSTEFHRRSGPLTTVPLPGSRSSLVWVDTPEAIAHLMALDDAAFARELEDHLQGLLGTVGDVGPRAAFALSGLRAEPLADRRICLVGEAGHVLPPIGAQGLNLGFRDAATAAECVEDARRAGRDIGGPDVTRNYADKRHWDVATRSFAVDLLNRSLVSAFLPLELLRGAGLHVLQAWPELRRGVIREGLQPSAFTPRLMQDETGEIPRP